MTRRHSRTPAVLTHDQQVALVRAADNDPGVRSVIETLLGKSWESMTFQQKVAAGCEYEEVGYALGAYAGAARGRRDAESAAEQIRHGVTLEDRNSVLEDQVSLLREELAAAKAQIHALRTSHVARKAEKARAVHSGEPESVTV